MKKRVYEVAKDFNLSSVALVEILKHLGVEVKSHMSSVEDDVIESVRKKFEAEKEAVKAREEETRKLQKAAADQEARDRAKRTAAVPPARPVTPVLPRPADRARKKKKKMDEREVRESVKRTLATMEGERKVKYRKKEHGGPGTAVAEDQNLLRVNEFITVAELASKMSVKATEVIAKCMGMGILASINHRLDKDSIEAVADEFGFRVEFVPEYGLEELEAAEAEEVEEEHLEARPPVVTIMGHVDHGKTSLLDYIRKTNVIAAEAGGITQHIGAYEVVVGDRRVCFLDTPGHEAFTAMRARGAQATDIVVVVVAADDRVMPQTVEAIDHAKAAGVPILIAINKIDLPDARADLVKQDLAKLGLLVEEWGGKTIAVEISAKKGTGVEKLLEMILLVADLQELQADPNRRAKGVVIEAKVEQGRGVVGTVLVQQGTLRIGDAFVSGNNFGKVRAMFNDRGGKVALAGPSIPVEVLGWSGTPLAGDSFTAVPSEQEAREIGLKRQQLAREQEHKRFQHISLTDLYSQIQKGEVSELNLILKGDVGGSVEVLADALGKLGTDEVKVRIIHQGVGSVNESDVLLASASNAIIIGFHVKTEPRAAQVAQRENVDVRLYQIIYEAVEDMKSAMSGLLKPELVERVTGSAEVRQVFQVSRSGTIAGSMVLSGTITRNSKTRVRRDKEIVFDGKIGSLKRFKDDVREVQSGFECGIGLEGFNDVHAKDIIETYTVEEVARRIQ